MWITSLDVPDAQEEIMVESDDVRETPFMCEKTRRRARIQAMCNFYPEFVEQCA